MESGEGTEEKEQPPRPVPEPPKRKMKTPYQLEILENSYAVEAYPSDSLRDELSVKTGLSDRQLQMWFCHRRLKDRTKRQRREDEPLPVLPRKNNDRLSSFSVGHDSRGKHKKPMFRAAPMGSRIEGDSSAIGKRYYDPEVLLPHPLPELTMAEKRILGSVESQLGEPVRQDGPVLGVEFASMPPGAFGAPIEMPAQQKQPICSYDGNFERFDTKSLKAAGFLSRMEHSLASSSNVNGKLEASISHMVHQQMGHRAIHEYQFLPEQPRVQSRTYDGVSQSLYHSSSIDVSSTREPSLPSASKNLHGNEQLTPNYTAPCPMSNADLLSQHERQQQFPFISMDFDDAPNSETSPVPSNGIRFDMHHVIGLQNQYISYDKSVRDEYFFTLARKRKCDEARVAKEAEVHEKWIRKELEKQDFMRRKREEQMRRETQRHGRERRKEEQWMVHQKQREEKFQQEQRRENKRREKFMLKESLRAEKLRQREELRRDKEAERQKAAKERATACRFRRQYMELIEDEQLELMELAAMNKGLISIFSLDSDTLQQLDSFKSMLQVFPPSSVRLRRPFGIQPWVDSDENIANLLMAWRFLITFADVLGLWPFTLEEFVQALHDYDSRLLGEISVSLLKSIIKDIADLVRNSAITVRASQNNSANPSNGHLHIVEGAYAWGFNIQSWQHHLNCLTWPEILRQIVLSAGLGPQLKKKDVAITYFCDKNVSNGGEDIISTLRNGSAVKNAVALMHERGHTYCRRSSHCLTPGTVKFAAFHVLSLEGGRGLTIHEVASKIQKSGLRDLTTSKTPKGSVAAVLSRDTQLFEKIAPSTYCVRSRYRKDPADADAVLSAALKKVLGFQSALSDYEEAEKDIEDVEDAERDEDTEDADDPEVDGAGMDPTLDKNDLFGSKLKDPRMYTSLGKGKGGDTEDTMLITFGNVEKVPPIPSSENLKTVGISGAAEHTDTSLKCHESANPDMEDTEIHESNFGEPWVQGLSEGDYCELSVQERLNALVSLIGLAIDGNSVRAVLEERIEAATALKKQMWAETQLEIRRSRQEYSGQLHGTMDGYKSETAKTTAATGGNQTPLDNVDKVNDDNLDTNKEQFVYLNQVNLCYSSMQEQTPDTSSVQQSGCAPEKSHALLKSFIGHKAEQLYAYRSLPLGQDRRRNCYWLFSTSSSPNDPGSGRIFFESKDGHWSLINSEEAFDALLAALDTRGIRESRLHSMLLRIERSFKEAIRRRQKTINSLKSVGDHAKPRDSKIMSSLDCSVENGSPDSPLTGLASDVLENPMSFKIGFEGDDVEKKSAVIRHQGFLRWMWKECYNEHVLCTMKYGEKRCSELLHTCDSCFQSFLLEERHCPSCHKTFKTFQTSDALFSEHLALCEQKRKSDHDWKSGLSNSTLPIRIRLLKAQLSMFEAGIPAEALQSFWTEHYRKSWAVKLDASSSAGELFQILTMLECAVKPDFLSSNFKTTAELLSSTGEVDADFLSVYSGTVPVLPWVPDTSAAVALRLLDLDLSISSKLNQKLEFQKEKEGDQNKIPSRYAVVNNKQKVETRETPEQVDYLNEARWLDFGSRRRGRGRGSEGQVSRGGRGRGQGRRGSRGSASFSRVNLMSQDLGILRKAKSKYTRRGRMCGRGGLRRGSRTVRSEQRSDCRVVSTTDKRSLFSSWITGSSKMTRVEDYSQTSGEKQWGTRQVTSSKYDDTNRDFESNENGQSYRDDYDDQVANEYHNDKLTGSTVGRSKEENNGDELDNDGEEDADYTWEEEGNEDEEDDGSASFSLEHSDS